MEKGCFIQYVLFRIIGKIENKLIYKPNFHYSLK